mmetsp:Transcript_4940/g.10085  ORF Transcript_4940/g.10085 Transcript_4940/m.10085 type:complete len:265 (-) Transcript_4940:179-973(-)
MKMLSGTNSLSTSTHCARWRFVVFMRYDLAPAWDPRVSWPSSSVIPGNTPPRMSATTSLQCLTGVPPTGEVQLADNVPPPTSGTGVAGVAGVAAASPPAVTAPPAGAAGLAGDAAASLPAGTIPSAGAAGCAGDAALLPASTAPPAGAAGLAGDTADLLPAGTTPPAGATSFAGDGAADCFLLSDSCVVVATAACACSCRSCRRRSFSLASRASASVAAAMANGDAGVAPVRSGVLTLPRPMPGAARVAPASDSLSVSADSMGA